mmetsp:Transcript_125035/g.266877  ORF Transcript_125035/g.266877 Transcript_125035/m.266877 type:complete len:307 (+) Transcript_125035:95-1015(+)
MLSLSWWFCFGFCICAPGTVSACDAGCEAVAVTMLQKSYRLLDGNSPLQDDGFKRNTRKPIVWIHIHKNAGTTICDLAQLNNETIVSGANCYWGHHDSQLLINTSNHTSCAERRHAYATNHWTFGMIEREIHEDDICEGFMYGILLREPVSHAVSFANAEFANVTRDLACHRSGALPCDQWMFKRGARPTVQSWIIFDNYQVRTLLGEDGLKIPPGKVTEQHVWKVIAMLSKFDLVSFVEELEGATGRMLGDTLGWKTTSVPHENSRLPFEQTISDQDMAYIEELNKMDRMVYDYFKHVPIDERGR